MSQAYSGADAAPIARISQIRHYPIPLRSGERVQCASADGALVASIRDSEIVVRRVVEPASERILSGHRMRVNAAAWSGQKLASCGNDRSIRVWDVEAASSELLEGHASGVTGIVWSPSGLLLASRSNDLTVRIWDLASGRTLQTVPSPWGRISSLAWLDSHRLAAGIDDGTVSIFDTAGRILSTTRLHTGAVRALAASSDGGLLISGADDCSVKIFRLAEDRLVKTLDGFESEIASAGMDRDGRFFFVLGTDRRARVYETGNWNCTASLDDVITAEFLQAGEGHDPIWATIIGREIAAEVIHWNVVPAASPVSGVAPDLPLAQAQQELIRSKRAAGRFDVFLCHNSTDKPRVKEIAYKLMEAGVLPWLDIWELPPGQAWQPLLERQIGTIKTAAVFVGSAGIGPWQEQEMYGFLREFVERKAPVIPVLLPDAPARPELPIFLRGITWVDFRSHDPDPLSMLLWGIRATTSAP